eukprot:9593862-Lingulodinium_polyedra.AAC.1
MQRWRGTLRDSPCCAAAAASGAQWHFSWHGQPCLHHTGGLRPRPPVLTATGRPCRGRHPRPS